jgi:hypothetical protein
MTQMVFIHGPGAGGCADSFVYQLEYYPGASRRRCLVIWSARPAPMWNDILIG